MRVFLTGATGFIGRRIAPELIEAGHRVVGLTRSDAGARMLEAAGVEVHRGTLEDPPSLAAGAALADAVIHTAFDHTFTDFTARMEKEQSALRAMGTELAGSDRPFIITSGTGMGSPTPGALATEDVIDRDKGVAAYVGDGANRWPAAHVTDVARLYRLVLDRHQKGARYHAVAEEGIPVRAIAEVLGGRLGVPVRSVAPDAAEGLLGWMARFAQVDLPASGAWTRRHLDWTPVGPDLLSDLRALDAAA